MGGSVIEIGRASKLIREMASALRLADPKVLIMLSASAYCSDSGMPGGPHCFLGGYLANVERWAKFCDGWQGLCEKHLEGKPLKLTAENPLSDSVLVEFAQCIVEHVETEIWTAAPEFYLNKIAVKYGVRFDRYRLCFHGLLEETVSNYRAHETGDEIAWFFSYPEESNGDSPIAELKVSLMRGFVDARSLLAHVNKNLLKAIVFEDFGAPPVQAAHFLVEHKRRYHSTPLDAPVDPAYEILRAANIRRFELVWFDHTLEDSLSRLRGAEK